MLWFAEFTAIFGFSFAFPFLPLYIRQLGVHDAHELALWTGLAGAAAGLSQALLSPAWGYLADRFGRKSMLVRAMVGGGLTVGAMGLVQTPAELVGVRLVQGASSGTVAAATTLVASGTPRDQVGRAMGLLSSAVALGTAVGPFAGGIAAGLLGLRRIFIGAGLLLLAAVVPVIAAVREPPRMHRGGARPPMSAAMRAAPRGTFGAILVILVAQTLQQIGYSGTQPLVTLKLISLIPHDNVAVFTGVAFAASGIANAVAAVFYSRLATRIGYRWVAAAGSLAAAGAIMLVAVARSPAVVVIATLATGLVFGTVIPATSAMLGLEAPAAVQGTIFGFSASAVALGFGLGPLVGGLVAGVANVEAALATIAAVAVLLALLMAVGGREPAQ